VNTPALTVLIGLGVLAAVSSLYGLSRVRKRKEARRKWELRRLCSVLLEVAVYREAAAVEFRQHLPRVRQACADFDVLMERDDYFRNSAYECWKVGSSQIADTEVLRIAQLGLAQHEARDVARLRALLAEGRPQIDERNSEYVESLKEKHAKLLSALSDPPLSDQQQDAVLNDEDRTLVIAGAGTGKSTTLKAKIQWLLQMGLAKPDELLVLSFARDIASELSAGLADHGITVETLHSYGRSLLASSGHRKLIVSKMAEDDAALIRFFDDKLQEMLRDPAETQLFDFLMNDLTPARLWVECESKEEYWDYIRTHEPRALRDGRRLRSYEEVRVANFLFAQGIEYEYERKYKEADTTAPGRQQYKPDFYLSQSKIYIEHFGVDRQGNPGFLKGSNAEDYKQGMSWKRRLHRDNGTTLVESYSWEAKDGVLEANLAEKLREVGVEFRPRSRQQMLASFNRDGRVSKLAKVLASVLNLFKEGDQSPDELAARAAEDSQRAQVIVQVFGQILDAYECELAHTECVDFHDMIHQARDLLEDTHLSLRLSYVLVDELQDISPAKAQFLIAILKACPGARLFSVGDDWQSIYRFTGSDVTVMTDFGALFGFHRDVLLNRTYRFGEHVEAVSSAFVQKNPVQIGKRLVPNKPGHHPSVHVVVDGTSSSKPESSARPALEKALQDIARRSKGKPRDVLVLGRYNHTWDGKKEIVSRIHADAPNLSVRFLTVHKSKGLEADYVIVADVNKDKYGFPCEITDDPVLDLVISHAEQYENAEERRLFYVALTRTKKDVYLLTTDGELSDFIVELSDKEYAVNFIDKPNQMKLERCSKCGIGRLEIYEGRFGKFRECRLCGYKPGMLRR